MYSVRVFACAVGVVCVSECVFKCVCAVCVVPVCVVCVSVQCVWYMTVLVCSVSQCV